MTYDTFYIQDKVDSMSADEAKEMLKKVARRHPSPILDIIEARPQQPGGYHPAPDSSTLPDWCSCNRCRDMPTPEERLCCGQLPDSCVSQLPVSQNCTIIFLYIRCYSQ